MVAKEPQGTPATLDSLAKLISQSAASTDRNFAALADDISSIKDDISSTKREIAEIKFTMGTKGDVHATVREELAPIRSELKSIRDDLDELMERFENVAGFRKEIDHALERIAAIEHHLKLDKKTAA